MMAKGLFTVGFTVQDVLDILATAKANLKAGDMITSYSVGGKTISKASTAPTLEVIDECQFALRQLDPDTYKPLRTVVRVRTQVDL